jgi:chitosanase
VRAWHRAAHDAAFRHAQDAERDRVYFDPAVRRAKRDGLRTLGQFVYYDAIVMHGPGRDASSFGGIRRAAMRVARTPAAGGSEVRYLDAFLDARKRVMRQEEAHSDTSRIDTEQRRFLRERNLGLRPRSPGTCTATATTSPADGLPSQLHHGTWVNRHLPRPARRGRRRPPYGPW